ncbi:MAG: hypothetical protein J3K34DRAFT_437959 [Monoraphidium minutum]|nr:MAG: hypothetical protein J3K34DRAFT_437959 [Monoraphidium minutum]
MLDAGTTAGAAAMSRCWRCSAVMSERMSSVGCGCGASDASVCVPKLLWGRACPADVDEPPPAAAGGRTPSSVSRSLLMTSVASVGRSGGRDSSSASGAPGSPPSASADSAPRRRSLSAVRMSTWSLSVLMAFTRRSRTRLAASRFFSRLIAALSSRPPRPASSPPEELPSPALDVRPIVGDSAALRGVR